MVKSYKLRNAQIRKNLPPEVKEDALLLVKGVWEKEKDGYFGWKPVNRKLGLDELGTVNWGQLHEGNFANLDYANFQGLRKCNDAREFRWLAILAMLIS